MNDAIARWWDAFREQAPQIDASFRAGHLPERTWLLFHDSDVRFQWRGLYNDTPEPPLSPFE